MNAGFARMCITPPVGTRMEGWGMYHERPFSESLHDDLFVRALYLKDRDEEALILAFDVLFFSRENADRLKAAVGRKLDLTPRQILINASHTHCGPHTSNYTYHISLPPDWDWLNVVEEQTVAAAKRAKGSAQDVTIWTGATRTHLPVSRRKPDGKGGVQWQPDPAVLVNRNLPFCLLKGRDGLPVCLLFSVSCHPSITQAHAFSAEYPGVACDRLDAHLKRTAAMFSQGAAGDTKAIMTAVLPEKGEASFRVGTWDDIRQAGEMVAGEVIAGLAGQLTEVEADMHSAIVETRWPLQKLPDRAAFGAAQADSRWIRRDWAKRHLELLDRGLPIRQEAPILVQGMSLGAGLRLIGVEGELVAELGLQISDGFARGVTFPLGYCNGMGLYLPNSRMIREGGYETTSYDEYGYAAPLAEGVEQVLRDGLEQIKCQGVGRMAPRRGASGKKPAESLAGGT